MSVLRRHSIFTCNEQFTFNFIISVSVPLRQCGRNCVTAVGPIGPCAWHLQPNEKSQACLSEHDELASQFDVAAAMSVAMCGIQSVLLRYRSWGQCSLTERSKSTGWQSEQNRSLQLTPLQRHSAVGTASESPTLNNINADRLSNRCNLSAAEVYTCLARKFGRKAYVCTTTAR